MALGQSRESGQTGGNWQKYVDMFRPGNGHTDNGCTLQEKALSELPNGSMVKNSSSRPGTQGDRLANKWKPAPTFSIGGLEKILDTTFEREEVTTLG